MSTLPVRTLLELVARYSLEPELNDLFVEGQFDADLVAHALEASGEETPPRLYLAETVELQPEEFARHGLTFGNKQILVVLAKEANLASPACRMRSMVDRDMDPHLGSIIDIPQVKYTHYSGLEMYVATELFITSLVLRIAKAKIRSWPLMYREIIRCLTAVFAMRLVDRMLSLSMIWIEPWKAMKRNGKKVDFDEDDYVNRLLSKNGNLGRADEFRTMYKAAGQKFSGDHRHFVRGHDLFGTLAWVIKVFGGLTAFGDSEALERATILASPSAPELMAFLRT